MLCVSSCQQNLVYPPWVLLKPSQWLNEAQITQDKITETLCVGLLDVIDAETSRHERFCSTAKVQLPGKRNSAVDN
jgi:hypothetical protein